MKVPLSYLQERLSFVDQLTSGNSDSAGTTYHNIPLILQGHGRIEMEQLAEALRLLACRHAALRTRIVTDASGPAQFVDEAPSVPLLERDLGAQTDSCVAIDFAVRESREPFAIESHSLVRCALLRFGSGEFLILLTLHHLIGDRSSLRLLAQELGELLRATSEGRTPAIPEPELQYSDYTLWQRSLPMEALEPLLFYWKWQLRGTLAALELPATRPLRNGNAVTQARHTFAWDTELGDAIRAFAAREHVGSATVTLAAFKSLLHRYTRQDEIVIGGTEPCRRQPSAARLVGPVDNLVVLRSRFRGNLSFRALAGTVERTLQEARDHQEMPFELLMRALDPAFGRTLPFDVLFHHDDVPMAEINFGRGITARVVDTNLGYGKFGLTLALQACADGSIAGAVVYNGDLYDSWFITQLMCHFERMIRAAITRPDTAIDDLPLLSAEEQRRQLIEWNATEANAPLDRTLHELFAEQALRSPDRIAVTDREARITYADLDARANCLAYHLQAQDVGTETLVAVCLDRSIDLIIALLAVLKAGGAYLPLDPSSPRERLAFTMRDSQAAHLVTTTSLRGMISQPIAHVTCLDVEGASFAGRSAQAPPNATRPEHLAYCIYTSGSTGQPKGALLEHRQVVRLMINDRLPFVFGGDDVWTLFHSCSFDFSVWEMFGALLYGGRLVIVPREVARDPALFAELVLREGVTVLNQTPTAFYEFAHEVLRERGKPLALRYVIFGGEALQPSRLRAFKDAYPAVKLINMYGITETTVHVTIAEVSDGDIAENLSNIGRPIPTTTTYLLDEKLRLVPNGVPGEIFVGGQGVGRGYLRRDELTRQRFIGDPNYSGERLYRSGDLARHLPDGRLVYLRRIDDQVQIRGFRVELGEIKTHLLRHPAVREVEVIARPRLSGGQELVAYVVPADDVSARELRHHLLEALPDYMAPSAFVMLKALPITSNGKVDSRALSEPERLGDAVGTNHVGPRNALEETLVALWAEVLQRERVGINDDFFECGGNSLLAMQLLSRVRAAFDIRLPLRHVFEAPTVEAFAPIIAAHSAQANKGKARVIPKTGRRQRTAAA